MMRLSWLEVEARLLRCPFSHPKRVMPHVYGVPRGGAIVAALLFPAVCIVDSPEKADLIIDDIVDSGKTKARLLEKYPEKRFWAMVDKQEEKITEWVQFPWEVADTEKDIEDAVLRMIEFIGEDPRRDGLKNTPKRVVKSWGELFKGYSQDPKDLITTFEKGTYDQLILLKDCELFSTCEHHLLPFFGKIHIGYIPSSNIVGISKLARIAECFSRRLQIQERIGEQIVDFLMERLKCKGAACVIEAKHFCMCSRGVNKQNSEMITSSLRGVFLETESRQEFMNLIRRT